MAEGSINRVEPLEDWSCAIPGTWDLFAIQTAQTQTGDALSRIFRNGSLSFSGIHPVGASIKRLEVGGVLSIPEFLQISSLLEAAKRAKNFSRNERDGIVTDSLTELFDTIEPM